MDFIMHPQSNNQLITAIRALSLIKEQDTE